MFFLQNTTAIRIKYARKIRVLYVINLYNIIDSLCKLKIQCVEIYLTLTNSFIPTSKPLFLRNVIQEAQYLIHQIYREGFQNGIYLY